VDRGQSCEPWRSRMSEHDLPVRDEIARIDGNIERIINER